MENYKPNSYLAKSKELENAEEKKVEKVVKNKVVVKKKNGFMKFAGSVIQEDAHSVGQYIFQEVLIPSLKKAIQDIVTNGIDMLLYGETGRSKRLPGSRVSYNSIYDSRPARRANVSYGTGYDYDDVIIESRQDAENILANMSDIIDRYRVVSVLDFYDLAGVTSNHNHTDNKYGWTDVKGASVVRVRDGYVIKLPRALPIE